MLFDLACIKGCKDLVCIDFPKHDGQGNPTQYHLNSLDIVEDYEMINANELLDSYGLDCLLD